MEEWYKRGTKFDEIYWVWGVRGREMSPFSTQVYVVV
jgi:hypothetical protein